MPMHVGYKDRHQVPIALSPLCIARGLSLCSSSLYSGASQLVVGLPASASQALGLQAGHHTQLAFMWVLDPNSAAHARLASLPVEPSLQLPSYTFFFFNPMVKPTV